MKKVLAFSTILLAFALLFAYSSGAVQADLPNPSTETNGEVFAAPAPFQPNTQQVPLPFKIALPLVFLSSDATGHASITKYEGPQTCIACHPSQGEAALHSEHIQWQGKWTQVNTYCTAPETSEYACLTCHATTGKVTNLTANDVDCLICHSNTYQRALGPMTDPLTITNWQGSQKTYMMPAKNSLGNYQFFPRFDLMPAGTTMESLARNVQMPDRATCLRCHAKAGGSDGAKRGDISSANINPPLASDVHMSPQGENMVCQTCHVTKDHKIAGKGIDLHVSEGTIRDCDSCHSTTPHGDSKLNQHTSHVACQTCHIPTYGKDVSTELSRDWTKPVWNPTGLFGQGSWLGEEAHGSNVKPSYTWWNGQTFVYELSNPIQPDPGGAFTMAKALGSINDGKIFPIKVHTAVQPRHDATGRMVQYDVRWNFLTGLFDDAAARGVSFMELSGSYTWVNARTEQLITHGVAPKANALACASCHETRTQMDLRTMGYSLKDTKTAVCTQCHENESIPPFYNMHNKHVTDKRYDCAWCHTFSRPERGLSKP